MSIRKSLHYCRQQDHGHGCTLSLSLNHRLQNKRSLPTLKHASSFVAVRMSTLSTCTSRVGVLALLAHFAGCFEWELCLNFDQAAAQTGYAQGWVIRRRRIIRRIVFITYLTVFFKLLRIIRFWALNEFCSHKPPRTPQKHSQAL